MYYKQIIATPASALRDMSYDAFVELFTSCTEELELLEASQAHEKKTGEFVKRQQLISKVETTRTNLTFHRHYQAYCDAQDKKYYDAVYHRPLLQSA